MPGLQCESQTFRVAKAIATANQRS